MATRSAVRDGLACSMRVPCSCEGLTPIYTDDTDFKTAARPRIHTDRRGFNYFYGIFWMGTLSGIFISNWSLASGWFRVSLVMVTVRLYWSSGRVMTILEGNEMPS